MKTEDQSDFDIELNNVREIDQEWETRNQGKMEAEVMHEIQEISSASEYDEDGFPIPTEAEL